MNWDRPRLAASTRGTACILLMFGERLFLSARQGSNAAAEFQKILDHRGIVRDSPIGALAHLQMGRVRHAR
jgi:hypothetical protein